MYFYNLLRCIIGFTVIILPSITLGQTSIPTAALSYPFKVQKTDGTWYQGHETMNRNQSSGYNFTELASYIHPTQGYTYIIFHPAWDMNVRGFGGDGDKGQIVYALADGKVLAPPNFGSGQDYKVPTTWNELAIEHNIGGKKWVTTYGHMQKILVKVNDIVVAGQPIGEVGDIPDSKGTVGAHLHLEVRDQGSHPDVNNPGYWDNSQNTTPETNKLHIMSNVESWYYHPELFIKGYPALGRTSNSTHIAAAQFISAYDRNQIAKTGENLWDKHQYWDQLVDKGTGDIYVHDWNGFDIQDLRNIGDNKNAALIYNSNDLNVYYMQDPHLDYWFVTGYQLGAPFTDPITVKFSNQTGLYSFANPGDELVVQKMGDPNGTRATIVENTKTSQTDHFPVGLFSLDYSSALPHTWKIMIDSNSANDISWPQEGITTPTGTWALVPGTYNFIRYENNQRQTGPGNTFMVTITEGNNQFAAPNTPSPTNPIPVTNVSATAQSSTQVILSWTDPNSPQAAPYQINRDGVAIATTSNLSFTDNSVVADQTYSYTISANGGAPESSPPEIITTPSDGNDNNSPQGSLTVTSPNGGEQIDFFETLPISWSGINSSVRIELSRDNGQTWEQLIDFGGAQTYNWQTDPPASDQCLIRVSDLFDLLGNFDISNSTFTIGNPNQAPNAVNDAVTTEYETDVIINVLANDNDPDGAIDAATVNIASNPGNGTTSVNTSTGKITYSPNSDFSGDDSFTYTVKDNEGTVSNTAAVTITVDSKPELSLSTTMLDLGGQAVGILSNNFTVENIGGSTLSGNISSPGLIQLGIESFSLTANQTAQCNVSIDVSSIYTGTYEDTVSISSNAGNATIIISYEVTPLIVHPVHDGFIKEGDSTEVYNTESLSIEHEPEDIRIAYLKFQVEGIGIRPIKNASLRLWCTNGSADEGGGGVYPASNTFLNTTAQWDENSLNWTNAPVIDSLFPLAGMGEVMTDTWVELPVTVSITKDSTYSFALVMTEGNWVRFHSKDNTNKPELVITLNEPRDNTRPVALNDSVRTAFNTSVTFPILANDSDPDGDMLDLNTLLITDQPNNGSITVFTGTDSIKYEPFPGFSGKDEIFYTVQDVNDSVSNQGAFLVTVDSTQSSNPTKFTLYPTDDAYIRSGIFGNFNFGSMLSLLVESDKTTYLKFDLSSINSSITNATLYLFSEINSTDGGALYVVENAYNGSTNSWTESGINANNAPSITGTSIATLGATTAGIHLTVDVTQSVQSGEIVSFALTKTNADAEYSSKETISINERPKLVVQTNGNGSVSNIPPVANNDTTFSSFETSIVIDVLGNDNDQDGTIDVTTVTFNTLPSNGTVAANASTGAVSYTPSNGFSGDDSFDYSVKDNDGATSNIATVLVAVENQVNTNPVAVNDTTTTGYETAVVIDVLSNDSDSDGSIDASSVNIIDNPGNGSTSVNASTGKITYSPNSGFAGDDTFFYTVKDNLGAISNDASVIVTVEEQVGTYQDILITQPNGGESYARSTSILIRWSVNNPSITLVKIELSTNNGTSWSMIGTQSITGTGDYQKSWSNSQIFTSPQCLIRVSDYWNSSNSDISDGTFTLVGVFGKNVDKDGYTNQIPTKFALHQNYPNPFNPETTLHYDLPKEGDISLVILAVNGTLVRTLVSKGTIKAPGSYQVTFDGKDENGSMLPSGVYIAVFKSGSFAQTRKLVLTK